MVVMATPPALQVAAVVAMYDDARWLKQVLVALKGIVQHVFVLVSSVPWAATAREGVYKAEKRRQKQRRKANRPGGGQNGKRKRSRAQAHILTETMEVLAEVLQENTYASPHGQYADSWRAGADAGHDAGHDVGDNGDDDEDDDDDEGVGGHVASPWVTVVPGSWDSEAAQRQFGQQLASMHPHRPYRHMQNDHGHRGGKRSNGDEERHMDRHSNGTGSNVASAEADADAEVATTDPLYYAPTVSVTQGGGSAGGAAVASGYSHALIIDGDEFWEPSELARFLEFVRVSTWAEEVDLVRYKRKRRERRREKEAKAKAKAAKEKVGQGAGEEATEGAEEVGKEEEAIVTRRDRDWREMGSTRAWYAHWDVYFKRLRRKVNPPSAFMSLAQLNGDFVRECPWYKNRVPCSLAVKASALLHTHAFPARGISGHNMAGNGLARCHHLSYVRTSQDLLHKKFASFSHAHEINVTTWYDTVWLEWDRIESADPTGVDAMRDLHPTDPAVFKRVVRQPFANMPPALRRMHRREVLSFASGRCASTETGEWDEIQRMMCAE
jgi:hypothetical protein